MESLKPYYDLLIPGDYFCDIIFTGLPRFPSLGQEIYSKDVAVVPGGVLNCVFAARRLGLNVGWVGTVGDDFFSHFILHRAHDEGIDTSLLNHCIDPQQRVTVSLSYPGDRAFISYVDKSPDTLDLLLSVLGRVTCKHVHFNGLVVDERIPGLIRDCHAQGTEVSMDCQHRDQITLDTPLVREILSQVDLFIPNACEAQSLTGTDSLQHAAAILRDITAYLVVKNGAKGAIACRGGQSWEAPALPLTSILDTTGAGDVFNAGFLTAHLRGCDVHECLQWGNFCGGMSTQGWSGTQTAPTLAQVQGWLAAQNARPAQP